MKRDYRKSVVAVLTRDYKTFLVGERAHVPGAWQFPQGGIEDGEDPDKAVIRELEEEVGTGEARIEKVSSEWISYDFPENMTHPIAIKYKGQSQKWYLLKLSEGAEPDLDKSDGEFRAIEWRSLSRIFSEIVEWKKESYSVGLQALELEG